MGDVDDFARPMAGGFSSNSHVKMEAARSDRSGRNLCFARDAAYSTDGPFCRVHNRELHLGSIRPFLVICDTIRCAK